MKLNIQLFAGSVSIGTITETTDIDTNQSTFTIPATMTTSGSTFNNDDAYMILQWRYSGENNWTTISKKTFGISANSSKTKSWTLSLTHEDDGTLTDVQFRVQWHITSSTSGTSSTKTYSPTTIPRASEITSVSSGTTVYNPTIVWTPLSSSFKYKVKYTGVLDSQSSISDLISPNTTSSYSYNGLSVYHYAFVNANSSTITATATLYTYKSDGTTLIGQKTKTFSITLNSDGKPSVSISNLVEVDTTMQSLNWGIYVQNHSKLSFKVTTDYSLLAADSVATTITTNGQTFTQNGYTNTTFTTNNVLYTSGTNTISATARDNRGRSTTASTTYNVVAYSNPTIATAQVQRCDVNGNITNEGDYCYISYGASISSCSNNNKTNTTYKVGYRVHNTGDYDYVDLADTLDSYSASGMLYTDGIYPANRGSGTKLQLSSSNTYDIQFYVEDTFTESTNVQVLDTGFDLMSFNPSGKAMAIGKVSEAGANEELLEIALPTEISETLSVSKYVKDELVVESIRSKNLLGLVDGTYTSNGITAVVSDGQITLSGTPASGTSFVQVPLIKNIDMKTNTDYTLGANNNFILGDNLNTQWAGIRVVYTNSTTSNSMSFYQKNNFRVLNNSSSLIVRALEIRTASGLTYNNNVIKPQLETGSTATNYSTHQHFEISNWVDKSSEITINNNNIQTNRTKLFVNENLRLVFLQVFYTATVSSTVSKPIQYPYMYRPAFLSSDQLWFTMSPSNGGANTCRGTIKYDTTNGTYIDIFTVSNSVAAPFGNIVYPY